MRLLLVHLSDIHLKQGRQENPMLSRLGSLCEAVQGVMMEVDTCFVVISGDIAFSGRSEEYALASEFLEELRRRLLQILGLRDLHIVMIPGNHDCDFRSHDRVRSILLENASNHTTDGSVIAACTSVQDAYFSFSGSFAREGVLPEPQHRIYWTDTFAVGGSSVVFHLLNSAWLSQLHEGQGRFFIPMGILADELSNTQEATLSIAVVHHPYNWMSSDNARALKVVLEQNMDLVLTGHEHESAIYMKNNLSGERNEYLEGGVLQVSGDPGVSTFNAIVLDIDNLQQMAIQFSLHPDGKYRRIGPEAWWPFERNKYRLRHRFELADDFLTFLDDLAMGFVHSRRNTVKLSEVYVYPDLYERHKVYEIGLPLTVLHGRDIINYIAEHKSVIILGADSSGKSALAKSLFLALRSSGLIPLFFNGKSFKAGDETFLVKKIADAFEAQYKGADSERYAQLEPRQRAVIVDDFDEARLSRRERNDLVKNLKRLFGVVLFFGDTSMALNAATDFQGVERDLWSSKTLELMEMGYVLRSQLVQRWFFLESHIVQEEGKFLGRVVHVEDLVTQFLGRNLLPAYPFFILAIMQDLVDEAIKDEAAGAFGYLYEVLITRNLARGPVAGVDLDTKYTYLTELAYRLFSEGLVHIGGDELAEWHRDYCREYRIHVDFGKMIDSLMKSSIVDSAEAGVYFKYRYMYYFFVARYFRDNLSHREDMRNHLKILLENLHEEDNSNIIMFLCHLSKDPIVLESMLSMAGTILTRFKPCDLALDVEFLNKLDSAAMDFVLDDDVLSNRQRYLEERDQRSAEYDSFVERHGVLQESREYREMSAALRVLEIVGHILRNFSGSLRGDIKRELIVGSSQLGLRLLSFAFFCIVVAQEKMKDLTPVLGLLLFPSIGDSGAETEQMDKEWRNQFTFEVSHSVAYEVVSLMAQSIGVKQISPLVREMSQIDSSISNKLIDVACRLRRAGEFPEKEVVALSRELRKNPFAERLLRRLVWFRFYIFPESYRLRQRVCALLRISIKDPRLIDTRSKLVEA